MNNDFEDRLWKRLDRMEDRNERLAELQSEIRADLQEHMRRTEIAEQGIASLGTRMKPLEGHVAGWAGAGKVLAVVVSLGAIVAVVIKLLGAG